MSDIVERLRKKPWRVDGDEVADEIEWLRADKTAISQTASDYLHEIKRLRAALKEIVGHEPFLGGDAWILRNKARLALDGDAKSVQTDQKTEKDK